MKIAPFLLIIIMASLITLAGCYHSQKYISENDFAVIEGDEAGFYRYHAEYVKEKYELRKNYDLAEESYVIGENPDIELESENLKGYTGNFYYKGPKNPESYSTRVDTVYSGYIPGYYGRTYYSVYPYYPIFAKRPGLNRHYGKSHEHGSQKARYNIFDRW